MKKALLPTLFLLCIAGFLSAQTTQQPNAFVGKRLWNDYYTPQGEGSLSDFDNLGSGFELGYLRSMSPHFNFGIPVQLMVSDLPESVDNVTTIGIDAIGQLQAYKPGSKVIPYVTAGVGGVLEEWEKLNFQLPIGVGVNFRIGDYVVITPQATFRKSLSDNRDNFQYGIGLGFFIGKNNTPEEAEDLVKNEDKDNDGVNDKEDLCPDVPGVIAFAGCPDTDADGIQDSKDQCPEVAGTKETLGCPDSDADGFADKRDKCPDEPGSVMGCPDDDSDGLANMDDECPLQAGPLNNSGCPIVDMDGDGFKDAEDACPEVPGTIRGCPDSDGDGFNDKEDACPNEAAPRSRNGCPIIEQSDQKILDDAVHSIHFEFSSATLKPISIPVLDQVKSVLDKYPNYKLSITGHTDNVGDASQNEVLSLKRANTCYKYLLSKGISRDRLVVKGLGEAEPIADNDTESGRAVNRRVEFEILEQ